MASHAALRSALLRELHHRSSADPATEVKVTDLAQALNQPVEHVVVIVRQLEGKRWARLQPGSYDPQFEEAFVVITMPGIEEAEKMERGVLRRFYEEHVVLWSLLLLIIGFLLNTLSGALINLSKPGSPITINVPEQKPPVINIVAPEQKNK